MEFHETKMGRVFYEGTMKRIADALEEANMLKKQELDLRGRELQLLEKEFAYRRILAAE